MSKGAVIFKFIRQLLGLVVVVLVTVGWGESKSPHRAMLLATGEDIAHANLDLIEATEREYISVEFLIRDDAYGMTKMALMRKKARQGKRVIMHVDALHLMVRPAIIKHLMDAGVVVEIFNPVELPKIANAGLRNHSKFRISDGRYLETGDTNSGNEYVQWGEGFHMQSRDVVLEGPAAIQAREFALQLSQSRLTASPKIEIASSEEVSRQHALINRRINTARSTLRFFGIEVDAPHLLLQPPVALVTKEDVHAAERELDEHLLRYEKMREEKAWGEPMVWFKSAMDVENATFYFDPIEKKGKQPGIDREVNNFMRFAEGDLKIVSPYLLFTDDDKSAVKERTAYGSNVSYYTNSFDQSDNKTVQRAYEYRARETAKLSPRLSGFEYHGNGTWHAKLLIAENSSMIMGYNIDFRSKYKNLETGVRIDSREMADALRATIQPQRADFRPVARDGGLTAEKEACESKLMSGNFIHDMLQRWLILAIEKQL